MMLCLDVGNSNICGGIFDRNKLLLQFRYATQHSNTSDQIGVFLKSVLHENNIDSQNITHIGICSVVPAIDYSIRAACKKYFTVEPFFLNHSAKTGLTINVHNPREVGADLIAAAIAATHTYPNENILIIDLGTATTILAISATQVLQSATILAGLRISIEALASNAAKLSSVEIKKPKQIIGNSTTTSLQTGLYFGHLGALKEITQRLTNELFQEQKPIVIGTGGFAHLFESENIFDHILPDLVLTGIRLALGAVAI